MYQLKLHAFNPPLHLLFHLIQKYQIDIYHIPIKALTQHYIQYLHPINQLQINLPTQYLLMPSQLLIIKSKLLFPQSSI
ncbi:segregation/condensation protein A, partial [Staphylococcus epidermidis]|uniref:segregation/condensation protein A n=1 Tax=Staphylococcus epidermidis TaxID=1282 RepID=UPI0016429673